jgi:hypothetical protein
MRWTVPSHRLVMVALLVAGAAAPPGWLLGTSSAQSTTPPDPCDASICQTATGPLTLLPAVQRLRFNVNNIAPTDALFTMVVIDAKDGVVLVKHQVVLPPFTGTSFEPDLGTRELPAIQVVGGVRVSRHRGAQGRGFGGSLELVDLETGRTAHILPLTIGGPRVSNLWGNDYWHAQSNFHNW